MKIKILLLVSLSLSLLPVSSQAVFSAWVVTESVEPREVPETVKDRLLWLKLREAIDTRNFDELETIIKQNPQVLTRENAKYAATYGNPDSVQVFVALAQNAGMASVCDVMPIAAISSPRAEEILARLSDCGINVGTTEGARTFAYNQAFVMRVSNDDTPDPLDWTFVRPDSKGGLRPRASVWRMSVLETLVRHGLNVNAKEYENGVEFYPVILDVWNNPTYFDRVAFFKTGVDPNAFVRTDIPLAPENIFDRRSLLGTAVEQDDLPLVRLLVEGGADVNALVLGRPIPVSDVPIAESYHFWETPLDRALLRGNGEIARYLIRHGAKLSPKIEGQVRVLQKRKKAELESLKKTGMPLSNAARNRVAKLDNILNLYRELGVPVFENVEPKGPNDQMKILLLVNDIPRAIRLWETEKENSGILIKAVASYLEKNASPELISAVLKRVPSDNKLIVNAFFSQIQKGNLSGVRAFVENGVSVNATDWTNASALFSAVMNRKIEIVKYLVEHGADIHSKTYPGYTPFSYAEGLRRSGVAEISNYLREADASREREEKAKGKELGK